jgi:hypothetical protein
MHFLIGLGLFLGALYFWLIGHWFARVVVFLLFAALFGMIGANLGSHLDIQIAISAAPTAPRVDPAPVMAIIGLLGGFALAWPVSGIPIYYWRARLIK